MLLSVLGVADCFFEGLLRLQHGVLHVSHRAELCDAANVTDDTYNGGKGR
jgi:hypothetical protein